MQVIFQGQPGQRQRRRKGSAAPKRSRCMCQSHSCCEEPSHPIVQPHRGRSSLLTRQTTRQKSLPDVSRWCVLDIPIYEWSVRVTCMCANTTDTDYETATATCQMVPLSEGLWHPLFICDPSWSYAKFTVTVNCHKDVAGLL